MLSDSTEPFAIGIATSRFFSSGRPVASKFFGFDQALLDFGSVYDFSTDGITILWNSNEKQLTGTEVNTTDFGGSLQFVKTGNGQPTVEISKVQVKVCYESVI